MQNIVIDKPYKYIPPHRGNWWPAFIQRFRLIDRWLAKGNGVVGYEVRGVEHLQDSLSQGHGILLTPNHARPCDPIAMGWLAREARTHVFAMASWHLYNQDWLTGFAITKMGAFSVYREGIDRTAINEAIKILATAERPLIIFPEGGVTRTNDQLHALLEGVAFIARSAAKRRAKNVANGQVVVHPVALRYFFQGDIHAALDPVLTDIEKRLSWRPQRNLALIDRITKVGKTLLTLKEIEYLGHSQDARFEMRLNTLINHLLEPLESEWLGKPQEGGIIGRVKSLRMKIMPDMINGEIEQSERDRRWRQLEDLYLAQQIASYPPSYLTSELSVERILETVERFVEDLTDKAAVIGELKVVIQVAPAMVVAPRRKKSSDGDELLREIGHVMQAMLEALAAESSRIKPPPTSASSQPAP